MLIMLKKFKSNIVYMYVIFIFILMSILVILGKSYYEKVIDKESAQLSTTITNIVNDAITKISFSGKYHSTLLIKDIVSKNPQILYIYIHDDNGKIIINNDKDKINKYVNSEHLKNYNKIINSKEPFIYRRIIDTKEIKDISIPYRSGYKNSITGVIHVGIITVEGNEIVRNGLVFIGLLILVLLILFMYQIHKRNKIKIELEDNERLMSTLFETANEGIWLIDRDKITFKTNRAMTQMLGMKDGEMVGKPIYQFVNKVGNKILKNNTYKSQVQKEGQHYEVDLIKKDGEYVSCLFNTAPLYNDDREVIGSFATVVDITEKKRSRVALEELNQTLERRVEEEITERRKQEEILIRQAFQISMNELLVNIAHQWRQPLNAIGLLAQNIEEYYEYGDLNSDNLNKTVERIVKILKELSNTIDTFASFYNAKKEKEIFSINEALMKSISLMDSAFKRNHIKVNINFMKDFKVYGDSNEFSQVILNILNNSTDAIKREKILNGKIDIKLEKIDNKIELDIIDNGGGIDSEIINRVFEPYFTTKHKAQGIGLGLYMVKNIIENSMNGDVFIENYLNGVKFTIKVKDE